MGCLFAFSLGGGTVGGGMTTPRPQIRLRPNKSPKRLRHGFPWAYENELVLDRRSKKIAPGTVVDLLASDKEFLAVCAFNPNSKIACRVLDAAQSAEIDAAWLENRLVQALALRERIYDEPFYRLVHAEADGLPGLIIDRFGDVVVIQPNAAWIDQRLDDLVAALKKVTGVTTIVKNGSSRARSIEGLEDETSLICGAIDGPIPVAMNGASYCADVMGGQKTGLYFDQRDNHAFAAKLAHGGNILDVFSHVGGFSLAAIAAGAETALAVDGSQAALDLAQLGAEQSGFGQKLTTRKGDAFEVMADLAQAGERFDLVVCDPPAFAPSKPALEAGLRAYERIARLGARLVAPGGFLVLCSCSHAADLSRFREVSLRGIGRAGRQGQVIHTGLAGPDHPVHPNLAETAYLKAIFLRLT